MAHEGLGPDYTICKQQFIAAVKDQIVRDLLAANPGDSAAEQKATEKIQAPSIQNSFTPMADAVYRIVAVSAKVNADAATDTAFWQWVASVNAWLAALASWQNGVAQAFAAWAPTQPAEQNLKNALMSVTQPGPPPTNAPISLTGRIE
jgi:hypothetical protein